MQRGMLILTAETAEDAENQLINCIVNRLIGNGNKLMVNLLTG
jgi:hypothetical protein